MYWYEDSRVQLISTAISSLWAFLPASITLPSQAASAPTSLAAVFKGQEGSKVRIPSVDQLCPPWRMQKNSHHEKIYDDFTSWVKLYANISSKHRGSRYGISSSHDALFLASLVDLNLHQLRLLRGCAQLVQRRAYKAQNLCNGCSIIGCNGISRHEPQKTANVDKIDSLGKPIISHYSVERRLSMLSSTFLGMMVWPTSREMRYS